MSENTANKPVSGDLKDFNIFDITQSLMMSRKTGLVTIQCGPKKGYVYFKDGQIIAALDDDLHTGEQAAFKIFYWRQGTFSIEFGVEAQERNIKLDTENLMLEVARRMDEAKRDEQFTPSASSPAEQVTQEFDDRFRTELHKIFKRVATETTPTRDRYTVRAFDSLLVALNDLSGTALFLRPDSRPRVKTSTGFETIKQETIAANEIDGFLNALLTPRERDIFREQKEITTWHSSREAGTFQVTVFFDYGKPACIFSPSSKSIPPLARLSGDSTRYSTLLPRRGGLTLLTGGLAQGKSTFLAALIEDGLRKHDLLTTLFSRHHVYSFSDDRGFIIRADLARFSLEQDGYLGSALRQGTDLVAVDELSSAAMLRDALQVAMSSTGVVAVIDAESPAELIERLRHWTQGPRSERTCRQLGGALRGVFDVHLRGDEQGKQGIDYWDVSPDQKVRITAGELEALAAVPVGG